MAKKTDTKELSVTEQAKQFLELPAEKQAKEYGNLPSAVQMEVRNMQTLATRGYRRVNGRIEFTKKELKAQIERLKEKRDSYDERKVVLDARIAELEEELSNRE